MRNFVLIVLIIAFSLQGCSDSEKEKPKSSGSSKLQVDFFQEEITLYVSDSVASVDGIYYFRNNTSKDFNMPVLFPFYIDSLSLFPHQIEASVFDDGIEKELPYKNRANFNGISMKIPLKANDITVWRLNYQQKIKAKRAVYIITSTAAWQKPLELATYYFIVPETFTDIEVWPEQDTAYSENGMKVYKSVRRDFMPLQEMKISWK